MPDLKRPVKSRGYRPQSPAMSKSRPGSAFGSRPSTPLLRPEPYTGTIRVGIRPNPLVGSGNSRYWHIDEDTNTITNLADNSSYTFDNIFPASLAISNREVYQHSCNHLVQSFLNEGFNCTLFAYGMTGSGKTYSMRGENHDPGFVRLAIDDIFDKIQAEQFTKKHTLTVSYFEIYNERIIDLLGTGPATLSDLKIRDDPEYGIKIVGVASPVISSKDHLLQLIKTGDMRRKTSATDFNARSSRSHAIMQLRLHTVDSIASTEVRRTLSLCDLAGSERATLSLERRKEGAFINKSLLALSTVINKLSLASTSMLASADHIPYRDSKLTRLLQPALSGSSLILILCTVHLGSNQPSRDEQIASETSNTLRFAARAKDIVMSVNTNRSHALETSDSQKLIEELRATIETQKQELHMLKQSALQNPMQPSNGGFEDSSVVAELRAEIRSQNEKIEHLNRLNNLQKTETILLRNDALNDILGADLDNGTLQMMMANLEEFYKRVNYEMEECKGYIGRLEHELKTALHSNYLKVGSMETSKNLSDKHYQDLLKEQEEEIWHLRENLKDKDQIIHSLTKTSKLRRLVDSNSSSVSDSLKRPSFSAHSGALSGKENLFPEPRSFNLSPTKGGF